MDAMFRPKESYKWLGLVSLLFCSGMMALSLFAAFWEGRGALGPLLLTCGGFGFFSAVSAIVLLAYYRESFSIKDGLIIQTGIVCQREMMLADITDAHWRIAPNGGSIVLRSSFQRIKIYIDNFDLDRKRLLIRLLHSSLPRSVQRDWERFCVQIALPLVKRSEDATLGTDEVLLTRRRWDRFFVVLAALMLPTSILCAWLLRTPSPLVIPAATLVATAAIWLMMRFSTPRQGMRDKKISATPEKGYLLFLLLWTAIISAPIYLLGDDHVGLDVALMTLWFAPIAWQCYRLDRRRKSAQDANAPAAVEEWERLENTDGAWERG
jgi:hypothetical protein